MSDPVVVIAEDDDVQRELDLRSRESSQNALESGRIDIKPEYLSSLLLFMDRGADASELPADVAGQLRELLRSRGITLLTPSPAEDTNQFVANVETADRYDLTTMSWQSPVATVSGWFERLSRPHVDGRYVIGVSPDGGHHLGIFDLAGFKKDRFYLYQAYWRPDEPMAHILPHWTWPGREGEVTPVHVYTSGDSAELFVNDVSQGRKSKGQYEYRLRWDDVVYQPGELRVVAYKADQEWATASVATAGSATKLALSADRTQISGDGVDLGFVTVQVLDETDRFVPQAANLISFEVSGPGEIVATDNCDPTDRRVFPSSERDAFSGMALAIVRAASNQSGTIAVTASADGLTPATLMIQAD